ncbi:MAG: hypothetical protein AB1776_07360 [Bacillota bacterium]
MRVKSEAMYYNASALHGVAPLAVHEGDFTYGQQVTLKVDHWQDGWVGPGNTGPLALGGNGANVYEENLKYGYRGRLAVGDIVDTEPGDMVGKTHSAVQYRLAACPHTPKCTIQHWERGCPRILTVPICETHGQKSGRTTLRVKGFAAFLIESCSEKGEITGRFIRLVTTGEGDNTAPGYGVTVVRLIV